MLKELYRILLIFTILVIVQWVLFQGNGWRGVWSNHHQTEDHPENEMEYRQNNYDSTTMERLSKLVNAFQNYFISEEDEFSNFRQQSIRYYGNQNNLHKLFLKLLTSDKPSLRIAITGGSISVPRGVKVTYFSHHKIGYSMCVLKWLLVHFSGYIFPPPSFLPNTNTIILMGFLKEHVVYK